MPFYTLVQHLPSNGSHATSRFMLVTPDQRTADHFYRSLQNNPGASWMEAVWRFDPQLWTYRSSGSNALENTLGQVYDNRYYDKAIQTEVRGKILLQYAPDRKGQAWFPLFSQKVIADPVNTRSFYIRNSHRPEEYWAFDSEDKLVKVSTTKRSKFRIRINGNTTDGLVMIDSDNVKLAVYDDDLQVQNVFLNDYGSVKYLGTQSAAGASEVFSFGAFGQGGFDVNYKDKDGGEWIKYVGASHAGGKVWELA